MDDGEGGEVLVEVVLSREMLRIIDDYVLAFSMESRSEAINELLMLALAAAPTFGSNLE
jgi:hypothetical protein